MQEYNVKVFDAATEWRQNGELHRTDGPAYEGANGTKYWYQHNKLHRTDGPAVEYPDGSKHWYQNGVEYTEDEFNKKIKPVKEMTLSQVIDIIGYEIKLVKE